MKMGTAAIVLALAFLASATVVARADEHLSAVQTGLTDTTISGFVATDTFDSTADGPLSVSSVPEPSIVALSAAALLAFVIFPKAGQRR